MITLVPPRLPGVIYRGRFYRMRAAVYAVFAALHAAGGGWVHVNTLARRTRLKPATVEVALVGVRAVAYKFGYKIQRKDKRNATARLCSYRMVSLVDGTGNKA